MTEQVFSRFLQTLYEVVKVQYFCAFVTAQLCIGNANTQLYGNKKVVRTIKKFPLVKYFLLGL